MILPLTPLHISGIPINIHPGAFGVTRKHDIHTGVDLYVRPEFQESPVIAPVSGEVIKVERFTGGALSPWWQDTDAVAILSEGMVYVCGEIRTNLREGNKVSIYDIIGTVAPVLPSSKIRQDISGHNNLMLHFEVIHHKYWTGEWIDWALGTPCPDGLADPTPFLLDMLRTHRTTQTILSHPRWIDLVR